MSATEQQQSQHADPSQAQHPAHPEMPHAAPGPAPQPPLQRAEVDTAPAPPEVPSPSFEPVYVAGKLRVEFPNKGLEKECEAAAQEISAKENRNVAPYQYGTIFGYIDKQPGSEQRTKPYRYLAENVNWILSVDEQEAYIIQPHSIVELNEFISYLRKLEQEQADQSTELLCVIVGVKESSSPVDAGEEIWLPVVQCNHIFDFDPNPAVILRKLGQSGENTTTKAIANLLNLLRVRQNLGASDFERAQNFLAFRYPDIYETRTSGMLVSGEGNHTIQKDTEAFLLSIETQYSPSAAETTLVDVIFNYQRTISGRQFSYFASVDVSSLYPFLQSPLSDYIPTHG
ncbi:hypothetical protein [Photobacterium sp. 1_MG-2023]|uniref:cyanobactin maturation protease PatG family protein n=1 Tax=Photobacterium sp. 1_MG-2023 TaxID=3062646 RepID=UPI0026E3A504|nr:hypothetical protein [Photobacterium sp. 1_MG-2023]MDO6708348.1 hypothetical protein [Photobacterium sp. 1_MG-2023]